jgi:double-stranded uracil-DNA glycosylase
MRVEGFAPVSRPDARVLILGTLPGEASLRACEYYAQPRNAFWQIVQCLFGIERTLPYEVRVDGLKHKGIALWDVCGAARRPGSLDTKISSSTVEPNLFEPFLARHPCIELMCFNGQKSHQLFQRMVQPTLSESDHLRFEVLPSTSAALAVPLEEKLSRWRVIADHCGGPATTHEASK